MRGRVILIIVIILVVCSGQLFADDRNPAGNVDLGDVLVSASKTEIYQGETGSSTTVITADDIKKMQATTVADVLRDVPGVTVTQAGAVGGYTSVYIRGADAGKTLGLIDGVELNDPTSPDRSFNFANLTVNNIDRIEIVRGPQSPLYGSDAMGGVINIITKSGSGKPSVEGSFEGGSHNTFIENLGSSGSVGKFNYSLFGTRLDSSSIPEAAGGTVDNPYHDNSISSKMGYQVFDNAKLSLVVNYTEAKKSDDNTNAEFLPMDTPGDYNSVSKELSSKIAFDQSINDWWTHTLSFSDHDIRRSDINSGDINNPIYSSTPFNDWYEGNNKEVEWQHNFSPLPWDTLTAGVDYKDETGASWSNQGITVENDRKSVYDMGYYLQNQFKFWDRLFITPGLRVDDNQIFGTDTTYKISSAYLISQTDTRLKGNWGTAFKAPSLYELYATPLLAYGFIGGNIGLKPEESKSYDFGFEQGFLNDQLSFDVTYFHNDFRNKISYVEVDPSTYSYGYVNIGKAVTRGYEFGMKYNILENLTLGSNYTYTFSEDKGTGSELFNRPRETSNAYIYWKFIKNANLNLGVTYVSDRLDVSGPINKDYTTVHLGASYDITKNLQIFGRIENVLGEKYREVYGYNTLGRSAYGGMKFKF